MSESKKRTTKVVEKETEITTVIEKGEPILETWNRPLRSIPAPAEIAPTPEGDKDDGDKGDRDKGNTEKGNGDKSSSEKKN